MFIRFESRLFYIDKSRVARRFIFLLTLRGALRVSGFGLRVVASNGKSSSESGLKSKIRDRNRNRWIVPVLETRLLVCRFPVSINT